MMQPIQATLGIILDNNSILLGEKTRGIGAGKLNCVGGKLDVGEKPSDCIIRETKEEIGIKVEEVIQIGTLNFNNKGNTDFQVHVFLIKKYIGEIIASDEFIPKWFPIQDIHFENLMDADKIWLKNLLNGERNFEYDFYLNSKYELERYEKIK